VFQYFLYAGCKKKVNATLDGNAKKSQEFRAPRRCERQTKKGLSNRQSQAARSGIAQLCVAGIDSNIAKHRGETPRLRVKKSGRRKLPPENFTIAKTN
jgi:hypothetical protein